LRATQAYPDEAQLVVKLQRLEIKAITTPTPEARHCAAHADL